MRRLDSRLIYGGEDSGTFSVTYRPIFFVKKLVGQLTVLNICRAFFNLLFRHGIIGNGLAFSPVLLRGTQKKTFPHSGNVGKGLYS